ncbi:ABC transporter ATP-binding protein [Motilimonas sp. KMU-193]|uniref:ABC transporter ATP-binding protein n=1 Tax=Motilimonas sp. KMU-193 TaxID=3388668 RepID=UPI00396B04A2
MNAIEINNLTKVYKGGNTALKGISLSVKQGDFYALLGPNGAGKSTTIGILSSLVNKTSGQVKIFGDDIDTDLEAAKRHIGLVPQEFNFNQFEPVEQILVNQAGYYGMPRKQAWQRAEICLKQLDLWDKRKQQSRTLSGGMKRRLMIARALMHQPKLLILDEPTAGVDIELRRSMWTFLRQLNQQGITIVLTTHYLEEAETLCRNIGIINKGELIENTSMKSLLARIARETFILDTTPISSKVTISPPFTLLDDHTLELEVSKGEGLNHAFNVLSELGVQVLSMRNKSNRLEELFVQLVQQGAK